MASNLPKTYIELSREFEAVMLSLQSETVDVDVAVKLYEQGLALSVELEKRLQAAENTVLQLKENLEF